MLKVGTVRRLELVVPFLGGLLGTGVRVYPVRPRSVLLTTLKGLLSLLVSFVEFSAVLVIKCL